MTINKTLEGTELTMALEGRLDTSTAPDLEAAVKEVAPDVTKITLDLKDLEYMSSAGLRVLLSTQKVMGAKGGQLVVCHVNETVMEVFEVTGFSDILTIE